MIPTQRLPASLTPLDVALTALLDRLEPVAPIELPLAQALGCVAADMPPLKAIPPHDIAAADGWAFCAADLVGASSYSPLPLSLSPVWVEAGAAIPQGCDCVIDTDLVDQTGPMVQVLAEAIPGQGVRRIGGDIAAGSFVIASGRRVRPLDLLIARAAGLERLNVRRPHLRIINIPATSGATATAQLIPRTRAGPVRMLSTPSHSTRRGTGRKGGRYRFVRFACHHRRQRRRPHRRNDRALARCGEVLAHGIALQPGRTAAVGRIGKIPVIVLPGAPDQALAAWWTLALPVLDRLSGRSRGRR